MLISQDEGDICRQKCILVIIMRVNINTFRTPRSCTFTIYIRIVQMGNIVIHIRLGFIYRCIYPPAIFIAPRGTTQSGQRPYPITALRRQISREKRLSLSYTAPVRLYAHQLADVALETTLYSLELFHIQCWRQNGNQRLRKMLPALSFALALWASSCLGPAQSAELPIPGRGFHGQLHHRASALRASYDYIVVGAGTSGLTVADRLSEDGKCENSLRRINRSPPIDIYNQQRS